MKQGRTISEVIKTLAPRDGLRAFDFCMAIGDERTDEEIFDILSVSLFFLFSPLASFCIYPLIYAFLSRS